MSTDDEKVMPSLAEHETNTVGPSTAAVVATVWCELFGVSQVEPSDDFFAMGGHSMLAVAMAARLRTELGLRVPVRTILDNPTPGRLSQLLVEAVQSTTDSAASRPTS